MRDWQRPERREEELELAILLGIDTRHKKYPITLSSNLLHV